LIRRLRGGRQFSASDAESANDVKLSEGGIVLESAEDATAEAIASAVGMKKTGFRNVIGQLPPSA
jgi:hypothetical protein